MFQFSLIQIQKRKLTGIFVIVHRTCSVFLQWKRRFRTQLSVDTTRKQRNKIFLVYGGRIGVSSIMTPLANNYGYIPTLWERSIWDSPLYFLNPLLLYKLHINQERKEREWLTLISLWNHTGTTTFFQGHRSKIPSQSSEDIGLRSLLEWTSLYLCTCTVLVFFFLII